MKQWALLVVAALAMVASSWWAILEHRAANEAREAAAYLDRVCTISNRSYVCPGCGQRCCYCFGAADDLPEVCDDCWAAAQDGAS